MTVVFDLPGSLGGFNPQDDPPPLVTKILVMGSATFEERGREKRVKGKDKGDYPNCFLTNRTLTIT